MSLTSRTSSMCSVVKIPHSSYPVTRSITLRYFNLIFVVGGLVYFVFITLINVVAVGYENLPISYPQYIPKEKLWYESFLPKNAALPHTWNCTASIIKVNEGSTPLQPD
jgi:hypothetical protein